MNSQAATLNPPQLRPEIDPRLLDTQRAFDGVAADYDGPIGNNALIQRMRATLWRTVIEGVPRGARLLDVGSGTGIDAVYFASRGYAVVATDWSPQMVARIQARAKDAGLQARVRAEAIGMQDLERLDGETFDAIYSDLGPLNCALDLRAVARSCSALLKGKGLLVASVIGRNCPWESIYYRLRGDFARARLRKARVSVPVNLNQQTVWTQYYTPREFYDAFADDFELMRYRGLGIFLPPPYLIRMYERARFLFEPLGWLDDHLGALPFFRDAGDHFLMVLGKRD
jgi:SAM-dependent methyltransferase